MTKCGFRRLPDHAHREIREHEARCGVDRWARLCIRSSEGTLDVLENRQVRAQRAADVDQAPMMSA
ncbi:hypothetical protein [Amycolatopsis sp.]|uniref:hypothetical protein n=1 Tax=Amycolatopsis sp. TaxID=37632 RepID=UPI002C9FBF9E|nr:hypothetical protein [Amycolatopsis sp.]HVV12509.1 hypothetical protein [Amycolatopsis sp.]